MKQKSIIKISAMISEDRLSTLKKQLKDNSEFVDEDLITTFYFTKNVKLMKDANHARIIIERNSDAEEIILKADDFDNAADAFEMLGSEIEMKLFEKISLFKSGKTNINLKQIRGFGNVIEFWQLLDEDNQTEITRIKNILREKIAELGLKETSSETLKEKFELYRNNWKDLV